MAHFVHGVLAGSDRAGNDVAASIAAIPGERGDEDVRDAVSRHVPGLDETARVVVAAIALERRRSVREIVVATEAAEAVGAVAVAVDRVVEVSSASGWMVPSSSAQSKPSTHASACLAVAVGVGGARDDLVAIVVDRIVAALVGTGMHGGVAVVAIGGVGQESAGAHSPPR